MSLPPVGDRSHTPSQVSDVKLLISSSAFMLQVFRSVRRLQPVLHPCSDPLCPLSPCVWRKHPTVVSAAWFVCDTSTRRLIQRHDALQSSPSWAFPVWAPVYSSFSHFSVEKKSLLCCVLGGSGKRTREDCRVERWRGASVC